MAARGLEEKLQEKVLEIAMRRDFDPRLFAWFLSRCGWVLQPILMEVVKGLIKHWSIDYDENHSKDCPDDTYLLVTILAKRMQESIDK